MPRAPQPRSPAFTRFATAGLALALLAAPLRAEAKPSAQDLARAEELFDNGRTLFAEGSYAAAATAFERAFELSGNLDMLYNAALAHDRAGEFEAAIDALDRYRALAPASERAALDERKRSLQARLDKQREAAAARSPDAVDDEPMYPGDTDDDDANPPPAPPPQEHGAADRTVRPWAWSLLGAAGALGIVATALGSTSLGRSRAAREGCVGPRDAPLCSAAVGPDAVASRRLALGADIGFAVAGAALVAFIAIAAVDVRRHRRQSQAHARVRPHGLGVAF
ncbi:MAG: hypothetical protein IPH07_06820 [Deltaproteobacteria bacterium]|nr:hypothetical protein [Deltaproteobacteria bacterium]MBK8236446.1 hypothetical protein [Deltaproteobacteria bacterium]MBK8717933.1 hypothetical protein [Deltaproteobacteria bacterium]MBP7288330.1 hypothetical protein [Nannocystaceae bacterium]